MSLDAVVRRKVLVGEPVQLIPSFPFTMFLKNTFLS
jgi:hypothetical protein